MIAIIDSGVANLTSVISALERLGAQATVTDNARVISSADRVILPGVGSAQIAFQSLAIKNLVSTIRELKQPVLGICLGMQFLFESSQEGATGEQPVPCLGIIKGMIRKLPSGANTPIPHMGWNTLKIKQRQSPLLNGIEDGTHMYFVHSFAAPVTDTSLATCAYGQDFAAVCGHQNFFGCQFHPERSGEAGQKLLKNFIEMDA